MKQKLFFMELLMYILGGTSSIALFKALVDQSILFAAIGVVLVVAFAVCFIVYGREERKITSEM